MYYGYKMGANRQKYSLELQSRMFHTLTQSFYIRLQSCLLENFSMFGMCGNQQILCLWELEKS
jgi:hypothetical protein